MPPKQARRPLPRTGSLAAFAAGLNAEQIAVVNALFEEFGDSGAGLDAAGLRDVLRALHAHLTDDEFGRLLKRVDANGDGRVQKEEFVEGLRWIQAAVEFSKDHERCDGHADVGEHGAGSAKPKAGPPRSLSRDAPGSRSIAEFAQAVGEDEVARLRELFAMCDVDGDNNVTPAELRSVMEQMGVAASDADFERMWQRLDRRKRGQLSFDDFLRGIRTLQQSLSFTGRGSSSAAAAAAPAAPPAQPAAAAASASPGGAAPGMTLRQQHDVLLQYVREVVRDGMAAAAASSDPATASALLGVVDYEVVQSLEAMVGGRLTNAQTDKNYAAALAKNA